MYIDHESAIKHCTYELFQVLVISTELINDISQLMCIFHLGGGVTFLPITTSMLDIVMSFWF